MIHTKQKIELFQGSKVSSPVSRPPVSALLSAPPPCVWLIVCPLSPIVVLRSLCLTILSYRYPRPLSCMFPVTGPTQCTVCCLLVWPLISVTWVRSPKSFWEFNIKLWFSATLLVAVLFLRGKWAVKGSDSFYSVISSTTLILRAVNMSQSAL